MFTPSVSAVAVRFLRQKTAGGTPFYIHRSGTNPGAMYEALVEEALQEFGDNPYSGTIATTNGFQVRSNTPMAHDMARSFAEKDIGYADKWGVAFAVPVAGMRVKNQVTVKWGVAADSKRSAEEVFRELVQSYAAGAVVETIITKVELRESKVPNFTLEPGRGTTYTVAILPDRTVAEGILSKEEAVAEVAALFKDPFYRGLASKSGAVVIREVTDLMVLRPESVQLPAWSVTADVLEVELGPLEGYLFYGVAAT